MSDGDFHAGGHYGTAPPTGWFHVVYNYIGPEYGQGTRVYYDGRLVTGTTQKRVFDIIEGDGRIAIGRLYTVSSERAGSHEVDELIMFNKVLTDEEIVRLNSN